MSTRSLTRLPTRKALAANTGDVLVTNRMQPTLEARSEKAILRLPGSLGTLALEEAGHRVRISTTLRCHAVGQPPGEAM